MKNLKRVLSLMLTVAMMIGFFAMSTSAAFKDQADIKHTEAVDMAVSLGIIQGFEDGKYYPEELVSRAQMAKMIAIIMNKGNDPVIESGSPAMFTDVTATGDVAWAFKYVQYCAAAKIVAGVGNNEFAPQGMVTGTEAAKMLLVSLGYDAAIQGYNGANWKMNVGRDSAFLYEDLRDLDPNAPLTRDSAAQMIWNALQAVEVEYKYNSAGELMDNKPVEKTITEGTVTRKLTLKEDKFGAMDAVYTMIGYSFDTKKNEFVYDFAEVDKAADAVDPALTKDVSYKSATDYTDLFGLNTKIIYKTSGSSTTVYGMFADDSTVLAQGSVGDLDANSVTEVDFGDDSYKVNYDTSTAADGADTLDLLPVVEQNRWNTFSDYNTVYTSDAVDPYSVRLIDWDNDGKVDFAVMLPFAWAEISSKNDKTINFKNQGGTTITPNANSASFEDDTIYEGADKGDYVQILLAANSAYDGNEVIQIPSVTGKVDRFETDSGNITKLRVDGETWYNVVSTARTGLVSDKNFDLYAIGSYVFYSAIAEERTLDELVFVSVANWDGFSVRARLVDANGDSVTKEIVKVDDTALTSDADAKALLGRLFTYTENGSGYDLTPIGQNNKLGNDHYITTVAFNAANKITQGSNGKLELAAGADTSDASITGSSVFSIADEATVFLYYEDGSNGFVTKVITGAQAKKLSEDFFDATKGVVTALYNKNGTVNTANVIGFYAPNASQAASTDDSDKYGYVVSTVSVDGTKNYFKLWDGETTTEVLYKGSVSIAKGMLLKYDVVAGSTDNEINNVAEVGALATPATTYKGQATGAITGVEIDSKGEGSIAFTVGTLIRGTVPASIEITEDTVVLSVNTKTKDSGTVATAADLDFVELAGGTYANNAFVVVNNKDEAVLVVMDNSSDSTFIRVP